MKLLHQLVVLHYYFRTKTSALQHQLVVQEQLLLEQKRTYVPPTTSGGISSLSVEEQLAQAKEQQVLLVNTKAKKLFRVYLIVFVGFLFLFFGWLTTLVMNYAGWYFSDLDFTQWNSFTLLYLLVIVMVSGSISLYSYLRILNNSKPFVTPIVKMMMKNQLTNDVKASSDHIRALEEQLHTGKVKVDPAQKQFELEKKHRLDTLQHELSDIKEVIASNERMYQTLSSSLELTDQFRVATSVEELLTLALHHHPSDVPALLTLYRRAIEDASLRINDGDKKEKLGRIHQLTDPVLDTLRRSVHQVSDEQSSTYKNLIERIDGILL